MDELVRIDATGVVRPIGRGAQETLARRAGNSLQLVPSPSHIVVMRNAQMADSDMLWLSGEISHAGRLHDICTMIAQARWRGELVICTPGVARTIMIADGNVIGAHSTAHPERLGEMLCHFGEMTADQVEHAIKGAGEGIRFGDAAVSLGFISRETLFRYLHRQTEQIVYAATSVARGTFGFYEDLDDTRLVFPVSMPLTELLMEGVRRMDEMEFFRTRIPALDHVPMPTDGHSVEPDSELYETWVAVDGSRDIEQVAAAAGQEIFTATRALFQLIGKGAVSLRPPGKSGPGAVVDIFNAAISLILSEVDKHRGASQDIRESLRSFAASGVVYGPIFQGAGPAADGTLAVARVIANLESVPDLDKPERLLAEWLYEYASFAMFIAEPVLRAGSQSDTSSIAGQVASLLAPLAPDF